MLKEVAGLEQSQKNWQRREMGGGFYLRHLILDKTDRQWWWKFIPDKKKNFFLIKKYKEYLVAHTLLRQMKAPWGLLYSWWFLRMRQKHQINSWYLRLNSYHDRWTSTQFCLKSRWCVSSWSRNTGMAYLIMRAFIGWKE